MSTKMFLTVQDYKNVSVCRLVGTNFSEQYCELMASVFQSENSHLRELDLGYNILRDFGVKLLTVGLNSVQCKIEKLGIADVGISDKACVTLALALQLANPHLRELDLSNNCIGDSGVKLLCEGLISPNSKLEILR
ncbi:hypothetical protein QTP70_019266 [Hemibagrus guttatus]|uniref:Uncharacterized protein n=1 Tax=Hemibagrus guttatus TaxID=175788 RepID=A0AAE0PQ59_9TELE|nr:hypothetical protein QTP70_019266 [Hemibagrus guttatus]